MIEARMNGFVVTGSVDEISQLVHNGVKISKKRRPYVMSGKYSKKSLNNHVNQGNYNKLVRSVAKKHLRTEEPIGKLLRETMHRAPGGTDYDNVRKAIKAIA